MTDSHDEWDGVERRHRFERVEDDRRKRLAETREQQRLAAEDDLDQLRDEVFNLVNQTHALRGTLQAYMPRQEVTRELDRRIDKVEKEWERRKQKEIEQVGQRLHRRSVVFWLIIAGIVLYTIVLSIVAWRTFHETRENERVLQHAVITACEQRKNLEAALVVILDGSVSRPRLGETQEEFVERRVQTEEYIESINSPPCGTLLNGNEEGGS